MTSLSGTSAVWKFQLGPGENLIPMPSGAHPLHVHEQGGLASLWAEVDPQADVAPRKIVVVGTGHDFVRRNAKYIGTFHLSDLVWHAYDFGGH